VTKAKDHLQDFSHNILCVKSATSGKELKVRSESIQGTAAETRLIGCSF